MSWEVSKNIRDFLENAPTRRELGFIDPALSASILKTGPVHIVNPRCFRKLMTLSLRKYIGLVCGLSRIWGYLMLKEIFLVKNWAKLAVFRPHFTVSTILESPKIRENQENCYHYLSINLILYQIAPKKSLIHFIWSLVMFCESSKDIICFFQNYLTPELTQYIFRNFRNFKQG